MTARGDSQNHADYARRMFGWELATGDPEAHVDLSDFLPPIAAATSACTSSVLAAAGSRGRTWISTPGTIGRRNWPGG